MLKAPTIVLHTSTLVSSFWNKSMKGRNLSCRYKGKEGGREGGREGEMGHHKTRWCSVV